MDEIWKPVPDYDILYEVSNLGQVRNLQRKTLLSLIPNVKGYLAVSLYPPNNPTHKGRKTCLVARLVYAAFHGPIPPGMTVNHKDGIKTHNHIDNLELMTNLENVHHAKYVLGHKSGTQGDRHGRRKLREADIPIVRAMLAEGMPRQDIADHFGLQSIRSIADIERGKLWVHIPDSSDPSLPKAPRRTKYLQGEQVASSRLRDQDIPVIRAMLAEGIPYRIIGRQFGVSRHPIYMIAKGKSFTHIP